VRDVWENSCRGQEAGDGRKEEGGERNTIRKWEKGIHDTQEDNMHGRSLRCKLPQMEVNEGALYGSATSGAMNSMEDTQ